MDVHKSGQTRLAAIVPASKSYNSLPIEQSVPAARIFQDGETVQEQAGS